MRPLEWTLVLHLFLALWVVATCLMPHTRTVEGAAKRLERSIKRGFIVTRPAGFSHVLARTVTAPRLRVVARGLEATRQVELETGIHRRTTASLISATRPLRGADASLALQKVTRTAFTSCFHSFGCFTMKSTHSSA